MDKPRDCYQCLFYSVCKLRYDIEKVIREHSGMIEGDSQYIAGFPTTIAPLCRKFKENPEGPI